MLLLEDLGRSAVCLVRSGVFGGEREPVAQREERTAVVDRALACVQLERAARELDRQLALAAKRCDA